METFLGNNFDYFMYPETNRYLNIRSAVSEAKIDSDDGLSENPKQDEVLDLGLHDFDKKFRFKKAQLGLY